MEDYKKENNAAYAANAEFYEKRFYRYTKNFHLKDLERFASELKGKKVLDVGCGPGIHLEWFRDHDIDALGIDLSDAFIQRCNEKGLNVRKMDFEQPLLWPNSFDGIWALAVLFHVPREKVPGVIEKWTKLLKPNGILFAGVREGQGEEYKPVGTMPEKKRFFTYFSEEEVKNYFFPKFDVVHGYVHEGEDNEKWIKYLFRKK